jgi:localization factor PodJL
MRENLQRGMRMTAGDPHVRGGVRRPARTPEQWLDDFVAELEARKNDSRHGSAAVAAQRLADLAPRRPRLLPAHDAKRDQNQGRAQSQAQILDAVASLLRDQQDDPARRAPPALPPRSHAGERLAELAASIRARKESERDGEASRRAEDLMQALRTDVGAIAERLDDLKPRDHTADIEQIEASLGRLAGRDDVAALEQSIATVSEQLERLAAARMGGAFELELSAIRDRLDHLSDIVMRHRDSVDESEANTLAFGKRLDLISHKLDILSKSHTLDVANQLDSLAARLDDLARLPSRAPDTHVAMDLLARKLDRIVPEQAQLADQIGTKLEQIAARVHNQTQLSTTVLEGQIQALAEHIDASQRDERMAADLGLAIEELSHKLDHVLPGQAHLAGGIAERIDQLTAAVRAQKEQGIGGLEKQIRALAGDLDALRRDDGGAVELGKAIDALARKIDQALPPQSALVNGIADRLDKLALLVKSHDLKNSVALEQQIRALADKIDATGRGDMHAAELGRAIAGLANKIDTALEATANQSAQRVAGSINERLDELAAIVTAASRGQRSDSIEKAIRALSDRIDAVHLSGDGKTDLTPIVESLLRRIDEAVSKPSQLSGSLHQRIDELAAMVARHYQGQRQNSGALEDRLRVLADQIDNINASSANAGAFAALQSGIINLAQRIDALSGGNANAAALEVVQRQLGELTHRIDALGGGDASVAALAIVQRQIAALGHRIDTLGRGDASGALEALQGQIADLAQRIDATSAGPRRGHDIGPTLDSLQRSIGGLSGHFGALRDDAARMADRAARLAVSETLAALPRAPTPPSERPLPVEEPQREPTTRTGEREADARGSFEALQEALHETLKDTAERLSTAEARAPVPPPPPPRIAAKLAANASVKGAAKDAVANEDRPGSASEALARAAARMAAAKAAAADKARAPLLKSAPKPIDETRAAVPAGLGPFDAPAPAGKPALKAVPGQPTVDRNDVKANFIAAARRAAQAAQGAAGAPARAAIPAAPPVTVDAANDHGDERIADLRPRLARRRASAWVPRVAIAAAAALLIAVGVARHVGDFPSLIGNGNGGATSERREVAVELGGQEKNQEKSQDKSRARGSDKAPDKTAAGRDLPANPFAETAEHTGALTRSLTRPDDQGAPADVKSADAKAGTQVATAGKAEAIAGRIERVDTIAGLKEIQTAPELSGLRQAALAGEPGAVYELGSRIADGRGIARDLPLAARLLEKAAEFGSAQAQYRLAGLYEKGMGVTRDGAQARKWYERAAEQGNAKAMHNLAVLLAEGSNGKPDYAVAVEWFKRAAEYGIRDSQYNLAILLARGLGTAQNLPQSYVWFSVAANQGDEDAGRKRDEVAGRLSASELKAVKAMLDEWKPKPLNPTVNEVSLPAGTFDAVSAMPVKPPAPKDKVAKGQRI